MPAVTVVTGDLASPGESRASEMQAATRGSVIVMGKSLIKRFDRDDFRSRFKGLFELGLSISNKILTRLISSELF